MMKKDLVASFGMHMTYPLVLKDGAVVGKYEAGALQKALAGISNPLSPESAHTDIGLSPERGPFGVVKLYYTAGIKPHTPSISAMFSDLLACGFRVWVQVIDEDNKLAGSEFSQAVTDSVRLVKGILSDLKIGEADAKHRVIMSYGNEVEVLSDGIPDRSWYFNLEAQAGKYFQEKGFSVGIGNDGSYMTTMRHLYDRALMLRKHSVKPAAFAIHAYGKDICGAMILPVSVALASYVQAMPDELSEYLPSPHDDDFIVWTEAALSPRASHGPHEAVWLYDFLFSAATLEMPICYFYLPNLNNEHIKGCLTAIFAQISIDGAPLVGTQYEALLGKFSAALDAASLSLKPVATAEDLSDIRSSANKEAEIRCSESSTQGAYGLWSQS